MLYFGSSRVVNVTVPEITVSGCMMLLINAETINAVFSILIDISDTSTDNTAYSQHHAVVL